MSKSLHATLCLELLICCRRFVQVDEEGRRLAAGLTVALAGIFIVANLGSCIWQTGPASARGFLGKAAPLPV